MKGHLTELRVGALQLTGRARQGPSHYREREPPTVVARDDHPREQVQPATLREGVRTHITPSDPRSRTGQSLLARSSSRALWH